MSNAAAACFNDRFPRHSLILSFNSIPAICVIVTKRHKKSKDKLYGKE